MTDPGLEAAVRAVFAPVSSYLALVLQNNPYGSSESLVDRPDVAAVMGAAFEEAQQIARQAVAEAWAEHSPDDRTLLQELLADVDRAYGQEAMGHLRSAVRHAYSMVALEHFATGVTAPGTHPVHESAALRAQAVEEAVETFARRTAFRSAMSADVASGAARTLAQLEAASAGAVKRWRTSRQPPDATTCHWCRKLDGVTIPVAESFGGFLGGPVDIAGHGHLTQPPKPYRGWLQGPLAHPNCRCRLEILPAGTVSPSGGGQEVSSPPGFLSAASIRDMPEDHYRSLTEFLRAASHELGQSLQRLGRLVRHE